MWNVTVASIMATLNIINPKDYTCPANCSGHGACLNGSCICVVQFQGGDCDEYNNTYFIAFGSVFYLLGCVAIIQLILCMRSEFQRAKTHSLSAACRISTQKTLYIMVILATFSRGLYFTLLKYIPNHWAANILSMYYPFLLSSCSLCVCFWAEAFHISDKSYERPGSLSKSLVYFLVFNVFLYAALIAQFVASEMVPEPTYLLKVVQGFFGSLIFIEVILFLAYGVEVYFKVKGAFANASTSLDPRTLHLSRFGLLFQGILQIITAFFLMMSVTEAKWNESIPLLQRNSYVIVFRIVELAMVMWFPCVLWNCRSPEKLWILNPKTILRENNDEERVAPPAQPIQTERREETNLLSCRRKQEPSTSTNTYQSTDTRNRSSTDPDCWICYDRDPSLGPLITPCTCKGDVAFVHHECLRKWMLELDDSPELIKCKVCKNTYDVKQGKVRLYQGLSSRDATLCFFAFFAMGSGPGAVYAILQAYPSSTINIVTIGMCVLLEMTCLRYLGYTIANAYKRAKIFSLKIMGKTSTSIIMENEASTSGVLEQSNEYTSSAEASSSKCEGATYGGVEVTSSNEVVEAEVIEAARTLEQCEVHETSSTFTEQVVSPGQPTLTKDIRI
ncbi:uncharacterized protein LOC121428572 [Lytechinus variegatus]|uniref:uncharacterized protein LOC121428572 n=1 Tax=Lytechinus variegatus TaxID=7654 RepID=UPI001BB0F5DA|nr:uncharacterized protein LOC121428572 [Lytechinus variegatus]